MRIAVFSSKSYDREALAAANARFGHALAFLEPRLQAATAPLAAGCDAACLFVNDQADAAALAALRDAGVRFVACRSAGFNNVDLKAAAALGLQVTRVPAYSPHAVAEFAIGLLLTLSRQIHRAHNRTRELNFSLDGLTGFDLHGKVAGVVGTGHIGAVAVRILLGFGCRVLTFDPLPSPECERLGAVPVAFDRLLAESDVVTLHCPLLPTTRHLIDDAALARMKPGAYLVNTSRGAIVDTPALLRALKSGRLGGVALDVYEGEAGVFFEPTSAQGVGDDILARLLTFPNVLVTGHQSFLTREALANIADSVLGSLADLEAGRPCANLVSA